MLRPWLELARVSNLPTVWTNVTGGWLLAGGGWCDPRLAFLLVAGSFLYTCGMILNDAADVKFDREHRKERPIPSGQISTRAAWTAGLLLMISGAGLAIFGGLANAVLVAALVVAILAYDLYHKPWTGAVWVMGACRMLLVTMAGSALIGDRRFEMAQTAGAITSPNDTYFVIDHWPAMGWTGLSELSSQVFIVAIVLGLYVVGLTKIARLEGKGRAPSPMAGLAAKLLLYSPGILAVALLFTSGSLRPIMILGDLRPLAPLILVFVFAAWVTFALRLMKRGGPAIGQAVGLLLAGIPIVDALAISRVSFPVALGFITLAPLLRLWQRWIAAT